MLHLSPPAMSTREAFDLCTSAKISLASRNRLDPYRESIAQAADTYQRACRTSSLHDLDQASFNPPPALKDDAEHLISLYTRRMGPDYPGRPVYELIRNQQTKCLLCGVGPVRQVDHHLSNSQELWMGPCCVAVISAAARWASARTSGSGWSR